MHETEKSSELKRYFEFLKQNTFKMKRRKRMTGKSGRFGAPDRFALKSGQPLCNFLRVKKSAVRQ